MIYRTNVNRPQTLVVGQLKLTRCRSSPWQKLLSDMALETKVLLKLGSRDYDLVGALSFQSKYGQPILRPDGDFGETGGSNPTH